MPFDNRYSQILSLATLAQTLLMYYLFMYARKRVRFPKDLLNLQLQTRIQSHDRNSQYRNHRTR